MDKWLSEKMEEQPNYNVGIGILFAFFIFYAIYRCLKCIQTNRELQEIPIDEPEIVVQRRIKICKLPAHFGQNAILFTVTGNYDRGILHAFVRHPNDFALRRKSTENDVTKFLRKTLKAENFIGEEDEPRGNRYIWKLKDKNGIPKQLVTILSPRGKAYELITAYKR